MLWDPLLCGLLRLCFTLIGFSGGFSYSSSLLVPACSYCLSSYEVTSQWSSLSNKIAHITYGNRKGSSRGMKLATWNPGSSHLPNKLNEIEIVIKKHRPHLLLVTEANLFSTHDLLQIQIQKYSLK